MGEFRVESGEWRVGSSDVRGQRAEGSFPLPTPHSPLSTLRRGVTLLEVLISIGVVAVGLLGVAALIPIGAFAVNETAKADRSAALGRAAQHEVRVRRMLERLRPDGTAPQWVLARYRVPMSNTHQFRRQYLIGQPFVIDPMFATEAMCDTNTNGYYECFPFKDLSFFTLNEQRLARLQLNIFEGILTDPQQLAVLNRIFRWQDDLIFDLDEDDPDLRPRQSCLWSDQSVAPYPDASATVTALHAKAADHYSWMLTAVPDPSELLNNPTLSHAEQLDALTNLRQKTYEVSIVTFYKRDFTCDTAAEPPSERFVEIQFIGTGIGGGDARLMVLTSEKTQEQAQEYLKVKENEWIMVTGLVREPRLDPIADEYLPLNDQLHRRIAKWYRVVRVDDEVDPTPYTDLNQTPNRDYWQRQITLAGPDWDSNWPYYIGPLHNQPRATIIDGVTGVYTTTITLE